VSKHLSDHLCFLTNIVRDASMKIHGHIITVGFYLTIWEGFLNFVLVTSFQSEDAFAELYYSQYS
jgi:hypothetical protein